MDFFFTCLGLAFLFWALMYEGGPIIKINRKCDCNRNLITYTVDHVAGTSSSRVTPRRSGGYHSASVDYSEMRPPRSSSGVVQPQNIAKPSKANVQPPKGGSGQSKINLNKEEE